MSVPFVAENLPLASASSIKFPPFRPNFLNSKFTLFTYYFIAESVKKTKKKKKKKKKKKRKEKKRKEKADRQR